MNHTEVVEEKTFNEFVEEWEDIPQWTTHYVCKLDEIATKLYDSIKDNLKGTGPMEDTEINSKNLYQWIEGHPFPYYGESVKDYAEQLLARNGDNGCYYSDGEGFLSDDLSNIEGLLVALRSVWLKYLYSHIKLPRSVALFLIETGGVGPEYRGKQLDAYEEFNYSEILIDLVN